MSSFFRLPDFRATYLPRAVTVLGPALSFLALLASLSVVWAWLWARTQSIGVVAVAHASVNAPFFWLESVDAFAYYAAAWLVIAMVVVIAKPARAPFGTRSRPAPDCSSRPLSP